MPGFHPESNYKKSNLRRGMGFKEIKSEIKATAEKQAEQAVDLDDDELYSLLESKETIESEKSKPAKKIPIPNIIKSASAEAKLSKIEEAFLEP